MCYSFPYRPVLDAIPRNMRLIGLPLTRKRLGPWIFCEIMDFARPGEADTHVVEKSVVCVLNLRIKLTFGFQLAGRQDFIPLLRLTERSQPKKEWKSHSMETGLYLSSQRCYSGLKYLFDFGIIAGQHFLIWNLGLLK